MPRKPVILAVDDTPANLVAIEAVLERDFELRFATSGAAAIAALELDPSVDAILMDLQMPVMDGFETAQRIKKLPGCADIPIVFVTAVFREDPYVKRGYEVGGIDYFTKPFDPDLLRMKMTVYASFRQRSTILEARERQLRETEQLMRAGRKLSAVLESLPVGILIADSDGRICQVTEEVARILKSDQLLEHHDYGAMLGWWDASDQPLKDQRGPLGRALHDGEATHNEILRIRCFDGSPKTIRMSASPLLGIGRTIVGAVVAISDLTESKLIEAEFESRVARLVSLGVELEQTNPVETS
jgi:PAS domain S-box-containing protein